MREGKKLLAITLSGLVAGRGGVMLVPAQNWRLTAGEAVIITGVNGAGKSTFLQTLAGLLAPLAGSVRVEGGLAPDGEPAGRIADIAHYLGHRNAMKPQMTLQANLAFWQHFQGGQAGKPGADDAVSMVLEAVGLDAIGHLPFGYLSAGQQRRAALARLLAAPRPLWLLDEPTAALDAASQMRFGEIARAHVASGGIIVAATHQPLGIAGAREVRIEPAAPQDTGLYGEIWL